MKKIWINRTRSFKKAEDFDNKYYLSLGASERLDIVQFLRESCFKARGRSNNARRKGLRRSIKIIQ